MIHAWATSLNQSDLANFSQGLPLGMIPSTTNLDDGTLIRALSPPPGVLGLGAAHTRPAVSDDVAHHDVRPGESLWSIASEFLGSGLLAWELARLNGLRDDAVLMPGQRLIVPDYTRDAATVSFMLEEMKRNATSADAQKIADALTRSRTAGDNASAALDQMRRAEWYQLLRRSGFQAQFDSQARISGIARAEAEGRFFLLVRTGGAWDHKWQLRRMYDAMPAPPRPFGTMERAYHFPIRGDLVHEYYYDVWSNVHYGFVGARCGFDEGTLQRRAGSGLPGAGDNDQGDVISVQIGFRLWQQHGRNIDANRLRAAIIARRGDYLKANADDRAAGGARAAKPTLVVISNNDYK